MTPDQGRAGRAGSGGRVGDSSAPALPPPRSPSLSLCTPPLICLFFLFCFTSSLPALSLLILLPPPHLICSLLLIPTYLAPLPPPPNPTCFTPPAKRDRTAYPLPPLLLHSWGGRGAGDYMDVGGCYVFGIMGNGYFWILGLCSGSLEVFFSS